MHKNILWGLQDSLLQRVFNSKTNSNTTEEDWVQESLKRPPDLNWKYFGWKRNLKTLVKLWQKRDYISLVFWYFNKYNLLIKMTSDFISFIAKPTAVPMAKGFNNNRIDQPKTNVMCDFIFETVSGVFIIFVVNICSFFS